MFNNWPYTNLNELNLDWILQQVKGIEDKYKDLDSAIAAGVEAVQHQEEVSLQDLDNMKMTIVTAINGVRDVAIVDVNATKTNAINDITTAQGTAESAIETDKTNALAAIAALGATWDEHYESLIAEMPADLASITQTLAILGRILTGESEQTVTFFMGDYAGGSKTDPTPASTSDVSTNMIIGGAGFKFAFTLDENVDADTKIYAIRWFEGKNPDTGVYTDEHVVSCGNVRTYNWTVPDTCYSFSITLRNSETLFTEAPASDIAMLRWYTTFSDFVSVDGDQDFTAEQKAQGRENIGAASDDVVTALKSALKATFVKKNISSSIEWEQGGLTGTSEYASATRIRTKTFLSPKNLIDITVPSGKMLSVCMYSSQNMSDFISATDWLSAGMYTIYSGMYYRLALKNSNDSNIAPVDASTTTFESYEQTDTTLLIANKAADAKITGDKIDSLKNAIDTVNALRYLEIDETAFVSGYVWSDGKVYTNSNFKHSDFLRCAFGKIKFNCLTSGDGIQCVAFYSGNTESSFISGYENTNSLRTYTVHEMTVPEGTKYIRVTKNYDSAYTSSVEPYVASRDKTESICERIDAAQATADEALYKVEHLDTAEILSDVYRTVVDDINLVDNTAYTPHTYVKNDGTISTTSNPSASTYPFCLSDYISVSAGKTVYLNDKFLTGQYYAFYTENKTYLGGKTEYGVWYTHNHVCSKTVPSTAAYLRVTSTTEADAQALWAGYTGTTPTGEVIKASDEEYVDYHYYPTNPCDYNGEEISVFNKIICIGDSITSGYFNAASDSQSIAKYAYPAFLQKLTGIETTNKGDAGETSVSWWAAHSSDDFSGYDCAIINLGINDVLTSVSEADTRSAFASIISALKTANTGIKIFIANINPAYSRGNTTYDAINEVIEDIATTTENCYFIDLTRYGHAVGVAYADGHLTACGYLRLAQDYKAAISWIIKNDPVGFRYVQFIGTNLQPAT